MEIYVEVDMPGCNGTVRISKRANRDRGGRVLTGGADGRSSAPGVISIWNTMRSGTRNCARISPPYSPCREC